MDGFGVIRRLAQNVQRDYSSVPSNSNWYNSGPWTPIMEPYTGAWQRNVTADPPSNLLAFSALFSTTTGICSDIAKMRIKLDRNNDGIWEEVTEAHGLSEDKARLELLRKPNHYQNRIKFVEQWILSKLLWGNTYVLKERGPRTSDGRPGPVIALYVLHPNCVHTLIADDGSVWYELTRDKLSQIDEEKTVPASEIIHDMMVALWHPLVGVSPIFACSMSATMGNRIQGNSTQFFQNLSRPGGMLSSPQRINDETAERLKRYWEENFGNRNIGRIAVAGDGLTFQQFDMPAVDLQLIEQLGWTVQDVARAFHYPQFKLGGPMPPYSSGPQVLTQMYLDDCLHPIIENFEICLDEGMSLPVNYATELDTDNLLRMDTATLFDSNTKAVGGGWMSPDEARLRNNMKPAKGGNTPYLQQQMWSLEQLSKRSGPDDAASTVKPIAPPGTQPPAVRSVEPEPLDADDLETLFDAEFRKELTLA